MTLRDIARLTTVFYIGGTKVGALCGEAVVFPKVRRSISSPWSSSRALAAGQGPLLGIQFDTLFTDDLYVSISRNAIQAAERLRAILRAKGYRFFMETPTNQIFVILENGEMKRLGEKVKFSFWEKLDEGHTVVRFATSWATDLNEIEELGKLL